MEDIFRILARGTSFEKLEKPWASLVQKKLPSEGTAPRPQLFTEADDQKSGQEVRSGDSSHRGIKRKRDGKKAPVESTNGGDLLSLTFQRKSEEDCKKIQKQHKLKVSVLSDLPPEFEAGSKAKKEFQKTISQPFESFKDLGPWFRASRRLVENVAHQGYGTPTEVQLAAIPLLLGSDDDRGLAKLKSKRSQPKAEVDLLTVAPTGSGKTLAFLIPLIQDLLHERAQAGHEELFDKDERFVKALILAPTHELVEQTVHEARKLVAGTRLKVSDMRKGGQIYQRHSSNGASKDGSEGWIKSDILVSTPLVLLNSLSAEATDDVQDLLSISYLILDEADVLLDPLFRDQTLAIWNACGNPLLRVSLWSATIGSSIEALTKTIIMERRSRLGLSPDNHFILRLVVGLKDSALPSISHRLIYTATEQGKLLAIRQMLRPSSNDPSSNVPALRPPFLVFTQTIERAKALHSELLYDIPAEAGGSSRIAVLHSQLTETARSDVMAGFRKGEVWILITTDLLARGVDFRGMNGVVNYDIPNTSAAYVHRAGRTGRAGREGGIAVTVYTEEDIPYVRNVANVISASEKQQGQTGENSIPKWLLDALPPVSKNTKKDLKKKGVASRRPGMDKEDKAVRRARISTKSGYDRKLEDRKKSIAASQRVTKSATNDSNGEKTSAADWDGLDD